MDYHQLLAYAEREEAREAKRTAANDADTTTTVTTPRDLRLLACDPVSSGKRNQQQRRTSSSRPHGVALHGRRCRM